MATNKKYTPARAGKAVGFNDRAVEVLVGLACGDALGAAYEFGGSETGEKIMEKCWAT